MPVIITSKQDKFRRCGMAHPKQATTYPDDKFSKKELAILQAETMLTVEIVADPEAEKAAAQKAAKEKAAADKAAAEKAAAAGDKSKETAQAKPAAPAKPAAAAKPAATKK